MSLPEQTTGSPRPEHRTGLIVVDVLNDFVLGNSVFPPYLREVSRGGGAAPPLRRVLAGARTAAIPVFYAPHGLSEQSYYSWKFLTDISRDNHTTGTGAWGANALADLAPVPGDHILTPHERAGDIEGTDLDAQLKQSGITRVVLVGLFEHGCIAAMARYALEMGYHVTLPSASGDGLHPFTSGI